MKKTAKLVLISSFILLFSACSQEEENSISNPITDPAGHTADMIGLERDMEKNIQDSVNKENNNNNMENNLAQKYNFALIKTSLGDIKIKFDTVNAPKTVENFLKLAQNNFYDGTKFHRVIKGFMIQGGDPFSKDDSLKDKWGTGGPGYKFNDELKGTEKYPQGTLAMANSGPNTNGSQFFIVTASPEASLPASYTVFGQVTTGLDVALKIENAKTGANDRPVEDVVIKNIELLEK